MKPEMRFYVFVLCLVVVGTALSGLACKSQTAAGDASVESVSPSVNVPELLAQADKLYEQREDLQRVREGLLLLKRARATDPRNYDAAWRVSKFNYQLGAHTKNEGERDKAFEDGIEAGRAAVALDDKKAEGHFWLGANYGGQAQVSPLSGLTSVDDIREQMNAVLKIDEGFQRGSAYMVLGQIELEAPRMLGGDVNKAIEYLEKGLKYGESNALLRLHLAEAYIRVNRKEDARKQLEALIKSTPDPNYLPEHKEAVEEARKMLEKGL